MSRVRWWSMYLTSSFAGCLLAAGLSIAGYRVKWPMITVTAREHAEQAARREGPYLAPVTFALILLGFAVLAAVFRWFV